MRAHLIKFERRAVGRRVLDFDCLDTAGKLEGTLEGFPGVGTGGYGPPGCFDAKAGQNIDITRSAHSLPATKQDEEWLQSCNKGWNTHPEL